jgi:hypothetical protein
MDRALFVTPFPQNWRLFIKLLAFKISWKIPNVND